MRVSGANAIGVHTVTAQREMLTGQEARKLKDDVASRATVAIGGTSNAYLNFLEDLLAAEGFAVRRIGPESALGITESDTPAVVTLDCESLGKATADVLRRIRRERAGARIPVLLLTEQQGDLVSSVSADGALDHHLSKSAGPQAIAVAVRRAVRAAAAAWQGSPLNYADVLLDPISHSVRRGDRDVRLTPTEFRLLQHFLANPERVFTRDELAEAAWPAKGPVGGRTIDVHVGRLRRALCTTEEQNLIRTVHSIGYALSTKQE